MINIISADQCVRQIRILKDLFIKRVFPNFEVNKWPANIPCMIDDVTQTPIIFLFLGLLVFVHMEQTQGLLTVPKELLVNEKIPVKVHKNLSLSVIHQGIYEVS